MEVLRESLFKPFLYFFSKEGRKIWLKMVIEVRSIAIKRPTARRSKRKFFIRKISKESFIDLTNPSRKLSFSHSSSTTLFIGFRNYLLICQLIDFLCRWSSSDLCDQPRGQQEDNSWKCSALIGRNQPTEPKSRRGK